MAILQLVSILSGPYHASQNCQSLRIKESDKNFIFFFITTINNLHKHRLHRRHQCFRLYQMTLHLRLKITKQWKFFYLHHCSLISICSLHQLLHHKHVRRCRKEYRRYPHQQKNKLFLNLTSSQNAEKQVMVFLCKL